MKYKHKRGQENNACAENYKYVLNKAREQIAYKRDTRHRKRIGQLSRNVVNVVALSACGRHNRGVRNRGAMVAADSARKAGGNADNHH